MIGQLGAYPRALLVAAAMMGVFALVPGLPFLPFMALSGLLFFIARTIPRRLQAQAAAAEAKARVEEAVKQADAKEKDSVKESLKTPEIELSLGRQVGSQIQASQGELGHRVAKMRRKFARQYGFVVPDIKVSDNLALPPKSYQILIHGTVAASQELRPARCWWWSATGRSPTCRATRCASPPSA